jgi:putative ABC transport system permease protein
LTFVVLRGVPVAWRSLTHDRKRFALSIAGITFATTLMFVQLGFQNAVFDSQVALLRRLNADLVITNRSKQHLGVNEPFGRRRLEQARAVPGVAAAYPLYIEGALSLWRNPQTRQVRIIRAIGVDPDDPALLDTSVEALRAALREQDSALIDIRSKDFFGPREPGTRTELAGRRIRVIGNFSLGTDFDYDGTVVMSDSNFLRFFPSQQTSEPGLGRVELGLVRIQAGQSAELVRERLEKSLPGDIRVLTKDQIIRQEIEFWQTSTPIGFIFGLGLAIGFAVGIVICSQILYTEVVDRLPLFGTLKAIGYTNAYLVRLVTGEALLLSVVSFIPGTVLAWILYGFLTSLVGFEMFLTAPRILLILSLTVSMAMSAAVVALRKALTADPSEVFK